MEDLLPAELTIDIFSRLPVETIFECKCVCKKWRNLLLQSSFIDLHHSRSPTGLIIHHKPNRNNPGILEWVEIEDKYDYPQLQHYGFMRLDLNLAPILHNTEIHLKGSVNGLICLWHNHLYIDYIYICNPVTREYMILPRQQQYYTEHYPTFNYGFGVSSLTGEYKVIRTFRPHKSDIFEAEVYTLGTGQWRSLGRVPYELYESYDGPFLNGHCHWIVSSNKEDVHEKICTFDLDKETFQLFPSPPPVEEEEAIQDSEYPYEYLAILNGCLCKMDFYESQLTIWVMKEYGIKESWHKEVVINEAISPHLDWMMDHPWNLIEGLKDGSILMLDQRKLLAFYPSDKTIEDTQLFDFSSNFVHGMAYRPSFLKLQNFELERVYMF